jgi:hypothetical protein
VNLAKDARDRRIEMSLTNSLLGIFSEVSSRIVAMQREPDFTCGDCERSDRCGLLPSDACIARAEQIARGDWKLRRQAKTLLHTAHWLGL